MPKTGFRKEVTMEKKYIIDRKLIEVLVIFLALYFVPPVNCLAVKETVSSSHDTKTGGQHTSGSDTFSKNREAARSSRDGPVDPVKKRTGGPGRLHALYHLAGSHLGIITRPLSGLYKLLNTIIYTGHDTLRNAFLLEPAPITAPPLNTGPGMDLVEWEKDLGEITGTNMSSGTIRYLIDGEEFYTRLIRSFIEAEKSIHIRIYIYDNDDYAIKIAELLKERSRDVDVRVLVDDLGTLLACGVHPDSVPEDHRPVISIKEYLTRDSEVRMRLYKNIWFTFDHVKTILLDGRTAFLGGANIGREYRYDWHDLMMEIDGPVVTILQNEFNQAWAYSGFFGDLGWALARKGKKDSVDSNDGYPIRVLYTRTNNSQIYRAHLAAIQRARRHIYIQNPYISDDAMLSELVMARNRGVDVRVIIPHEANWKVMNRSNKLAANTMMANGIKVYLYPVMSHVKAAIFDGWACVGSANFDKASFRTNQEIDLAFSHPEAVAELKERIFDCDFERSRLMTEPYPVTWRDQLYEVVADQM
jgi:cardiolipin synthase